MAVRDQKNAASRRAVADLLRRFFTDLTAQLASGTADIWNKVERRLTQKPAETEAKGEAPPPTFLRTPMQQQPVQQQQSKAEPDKEK